MSLKIDKVIVQQFKYKGYINLIPLYKGKWLFKYTVTIFPSCYEDIPYYTNEIKKRVLGD